MNDRSYSELADHITPVPDHDPATGAYRFLAEVTENWTQGRACFGGIQAAFSLRAMAMVLREDTPLRSILVSFVAPIAVGEIEIQVRKLRQGKNVTHMHAEIIQGNNVCCSMNACFGLARESSVELEAKSFPEGVKGPEGVVELPYIKGLTPEFTRQYQMRWGIGSMPFSAQKGNTTGIWVKGKEEGLSDMEHLVMVADIPPTPALSKMKKPAPASSLTWMLEILKDDFVARKDDWWFVETTLEHFNHGYGQQQYTIYAPDKTPVALGRQVVTVFG
ncbi:thioesterase family protein [Parendozoicomonas sp. Alg238-R29]|uniref:acyl-CoA thioesterase n=1 Tax=Parendozoicomonas sp. Alg238-R29 TaxID=2993446 RepID=UPI00248EE140|nr:thioesterase family protein [Parendozoicomonas sp. Alg238-R29]